MRIAVITPYYKKRLPDCGGPQRAVPRQHVELVGRIFVSRLPNDEVDGFEPRAHIWVLNREAYGGKPLAIGAAHAVNRRNEGVAFVDAVRGYNRARPCRRRRWSASFPLVVSLYDESAGCAPTGLHPSRHGLPITANSAGA